MTIDAAQTKHYESKGYLLVRDVFSHQEVDNLRSACLRGERGDVLGIPAFNQVPLDDRLLEIARGLLGEDIVYFGYGSSRNGSDSNPQDNHFHVDARSDDRDYTKSYPILRMGIYLQDHARHSDGLKLRPGSHRVPCLGLTDWKGYGYWLIKRRWSGVLRWLPSRNVPTQPGDVVVWNLRTHHSGNAVRLRLWPGHSFRPVIERLIPRWLRLPIEEERCVIFLTYGAPSEYLDRFIEHRAHNPNEASFWKASRTADPEVLRALEEKNVQIRLDGINAARSD